MEYNLEQKKEFIARNVYNVGSEIHNAAGYIVLTAGYEKEIRSTSTGAIVALNRLPENVVSSLFDLFRNEINKTKNSNKY